MWLDDSVNIYQPLSLADSDVVETFYKDNTALYTVTIEEDKRIETVDEIRKIIGDENAMTGDAVSTAVASVQFVNKTDAIEMEDVDNVEEEPEEELTFVQKVMRLFGMY